MSEDGNEELFDIDTMSEIGPATKTSLRQAGFKTIKDIVIRGPADIAEATGIAMDICSSMCYMAREILVEIGVFD